MAKKKTDSTEAKSGGKKKSADAAKPAGMPMIDTDAAAVAAARLVGGGLPRPSDKPAGDKTESAMFKQLKAGAHKPAGSIGGALSGMPGGKKTNQPQHPDQQKGHNQTFGADSSRTYIPRRTSG